MTATRTLYSASSGNRTIAWSSRLSVSARCLPFSFHSLLIVEASSGKRKASASPTRVNTSLRGISTLARTSPACFQMRTNFSFATSTWRTVSGAGRSPALGGPGTWASAIRRATLEGPLSGMLCTMKLALGYPANAAVWNTLFTTTAFALGSIRRTFTPGNHSVREVPGSESSPSGRRRGARAQVCRGPSLTVGVASTRLRGASLPACAKKERRRQRAAVWGCVVVSVHL